MTRRLSTLLALLLLLLLAAPAKDKDKKKPVFPEDVLRAETALVVIDPDAGEPIDQPNANAIARDNVEKALMEWGRFRLVLDGQESDLVIAVRTGNGKSVRPTIRGGPIDQRPGVAQGTDSSIRIGGQRGQPPNGYPNNDPMDRSPHVSNEIGASEDSFVVYRGRLGDPLNSPPVWRLIKKECLRPTGSQVPAVEEFRKALAEAEKPQVPKTP